MLWQALPGFICGRGGLDGNATSPADAFLARTSGLDGTHITAYTNLINGLDTDGLFAKLDFLHVYATQDSATALLNLVSTSFNGTSHGSPTFTADRGYTGVESSNTVYIDTGFTPSSGTPQYTQNSAHLSAWALNNITSGHPAIGLVSSGAPNESDLYVKFSDNNTYYRVNGAGASGFANATAIGHYIGTRTSSSNVDGYKNGSSVGSTSGSSQVTTALGNFYTLGINSDATPLGSGHQLAAASAGAAFNSTEASNFYTRLRTFGTAVGVP